MQKLGLLVGQVFSGLRFRLLVLVLIACSPLVLLTLSRAWEDRQRARNGWSQRSERMLEVAGREEEKLLGETRQLLLALGESAPVRAGNRRGCKRLVDELFASYPRFANLGVFNTNGDILASAVSVGGKAAVADHEFFCRVLESGGLTIGDFPTGFVGDKPVVNIGYPSFDRFGEPVGAVFAALDLNWLNRFGTALPSQLPRGATWTELDQKGRILIRSPGPKTLIGQLFPDKGLLKSIASKREGIIDKPDAAGVPMIYAVTTMKSQLVPGEITTLLGIPKQMLFASTDRALFRTLGWLTLAAGLAIILGWIGSDLLVVRPVKALVHSSARLAAGDLTARTGLPHGRDEVGRLTLAFDLMAQSLEQRETERNRTSHKLQILSHRLVEVQETERRQIARELHDEIGQSLTVAEMNLQAALAASGQAALTRRLEESIQAVERVVDQVHDLSLNLRPSMLDDLGLEPALRWYTSRQAALTGLRARFRADSLPRRLDPIIETECFRIAQEALTNVVRHSKGRSVLVQLSRLDGELHLRVRDDGIGFDVASLRDEAVRGASLGLLSMEERATLAGGGLEFNSAPGKGTEIHAWFPLRWREDRA